MVATLDVHHLPARHLAPAGEIIARAFFDDPLWEYILPSAPQRTRDMPWLMDMAVRYGERFGQVFVGGWPMNCAAVWLPPGQTTITPDRLDEVGFAASPARLGSEAFARFDRLIDDLGKRRAELMPEPHWYLMMVGVEAAVRGHGIGSRLLQAVLDRADSQHVPCHLHTSRERNLAFFGRHGFETVGEMDLPDGPRVWLMVRRTRT